MKWALQEIIRCKFKSFKSAIVKFLLEFKVLIMIVLIRQPPVTGISSEYIKFEGVMELIKFY